MSIRIPPVVRTQEASDTPMEDSVFNNTIISDNVQEAFDKICAPDTSVKPTFYASGSNEGEIDFIEFFKGTTQTTPNRIFKVDLTYDGNLNPTTEVWELYDTDGTTILKTVTFTHTWSGVDLVKTEMVTT